MLNGASLDGVAMPRIASWSFEKAYDRPQTTDSTGSSPNLSSLNESEVIAFTPPRQRPIPPKLITDDASLQDKYLSSEEDLSPLGSDFSSDFELDEEDVHYETATVVRAPVKVPESSVARVVSYFSAGRPKMVQVSCSPPRLQPRTYRRQSLSPDSATSSGSEYTTPPSSTASRSPLAEFSGWEQLQRRPVPAPSAEQKRISTVSLASGLYNSGMQDSRYPVSAHPQTQSNKVFFPTSQRSMSISAPMSQDSSSFLNTDPFNSDSRSSASPTIQSGKRLRGITRTLTLAKAMSKRRDSPITREQHLSFQLPPSPATPATPATPRSPQASSPQVVRSMLYPDEEVPPVPRLSRPRPKMVARGANERAPPIELPPFPGNDMRFFDDENPRLRKRGSMMGYI